MFFLGRADDSNTLQGWAAEAEAINALVMHHYMIKQDDNSDKQGLK